MWHNPNVSIDEKSSLPRVNKVDAGKLEAVFGHTTASYKYLLLKAVLQLLDQASNNGRDVCFQISEIRIEMLVNAWFPSQFFRLSFGRQDTLGLSLGSIYRELFSETSILTTQDARRYFRAHANVIQRKYMIGSNDPLRYAPERVLSPWFSDYILRKPDGRKGKIIAELSRELFGVRKPLYLVSQDRRSVRLHPDWIDYLLDNYAVVNGWLDMKWLQYLQSKNPNVPSLSTKLWALPGQRENLIRQRKFWKPILHRGFNCIYTKEPVPPNNFALDHFLPRAWVGHDQLWNLVPVSKTVNSSKGAKLPSITDINHLADAHVRIIEITLESAREQTKKLDDYMSGLNITIDKPVDATVIKGAYMNTIGPQLRLASDRGFGNWNRD